jgi:ribosome-binding factor A
MMQGARTARVGDLIREALGGMLVRDVRDPGVRTVTITRVRMSKDLQQARVYYTALTDEQGRRDAARALKRARPFFKRRLGTALRLRYVPELAFVHDDGVEGQDRVARLLDELHPTGDEAPQTDDSDRT